MSTEALTVPQCAMQCFPYCQNSFGVFSGCTERDHMSNKVGIGCCVSTWILLCGS